MKSLWLILGIVVIAIIVYFGYRSYYPTSTTSTNSANNTSATVSATTVEAKNMAFNPARISISAGQTVTFTNNDAVSHTATADDKSFDSGTLAPGATFKKTFTTAGTVSYHCSIHPNMTGSVTIN